MFQQKRQTLGRDKVPAERDVDHLEKCHSLSAALRAKQILDNKTSTVSFDTNRQRLEGNWDRKTSSIQRWNGKPSGGKARRLCAARLLARMIRPTEARRGRPARIVQVEAEL